MNTAPLPRSLMIEAATRLARARSEMDAANERARQTCTRVELLKNRPDLLHVETLVEDLPRRKERVFLAESTYQQAVEQRLQAKIREYPFAAPPELEQEIALCHEAILSLNRERWRPLHETTSRTRTFDPATGRDAMDASPDVWLNHFEQQRSVLKQFHHDRLRSEVEGELSELNSHVLEARRALSEADEASKRHPEIDDYVSSQQEGLRAAQTNDAKMELEAAVAAFHAARCECIAQFQARLKDDFLATRLEDFVPSGDTVLREDLQKCKTDFVIEWASLHTDKKPDIEQASAIGSVHEDVLVTARAGSGKTSTLVSRAAFLVKHCRVLPEELLLLVFNKNAAEEMRDKLEKMACNVPHTMTFHALAYSIVHPDENLIYDSPDDTHPARTRAFRQVLNDLRDQDRFYKDIRSVMLSHFRADWDKLTRAGLTLSKEQGLAFRRALRTETLNGDYVKSFGEKTIANFLFEHGIQYKYERTFPWHGRSYRPDFTIPPQGKNGIVIEYFGLKGDPDYDEQSDSKREYWRQKAGWRLIELKPADFARGKAHFDDTLRTQLEAFGIACLRLSEEEIWNRIRERAIDRFDRMTGNFVGRCRSAGISPQMLDNRVATHQSLLEHVGKVTLNPLMSQG